MKELETSDDDERDYRVEVACKALHTAGLHALVADAFGNAQRQVEVAYPEPIGADLRVVIRAVRIDGDWYYRQPGAGRSPICQADDLEALIAWVKELVTPPYGLRGMAHAAKPSREALSWLS